MVDRKRVWRAKYYKDRKRKKVTEKKAVNRVTKVKIAKRTPKPSSNVIKKSERSKLIKKAPKVVEVRRKAPAKKKVQSKGK